MQIMKIIEATRTAKSHAMNDRSSRSHCLVSIKQTKKSGKNAVSSKFTFVDLAGSERIAKSLATEVKAAEAKNINTSLSALGRTIKELSKSKNQFIPWRDSALTMLMKDSLSGNCITQLIVCVAETSEYAQETTSTLRFGLTCGQIKGDVQQQKSYNVDNRAMQLKGSIDQLTMIIDQMDRDGQGGLMDMSVPKPTRDGFQSNLDKLAKCKKQMTEIQLKLQEPGVDREKVMAKKQEAT